MEQYFRTQLKQQYTLLPLTPRPPGAPMFPRLPWKRQKKIGLVFCQSLEMWLSLRLCSHNTGYLFGLTGKAIWLSMTALARDRSESFTHIEHAPEWLAERVWCTQFQSSFLNINFRLSWFQSPLLLNHFLYGPNTASLHCIKVWHRNYLISDAPEISEAQVPSGPLHTEIAPTCEQKPYLVRFSCWRKSNPVQCKHSLKLEIWLTADPFSPVAPLSPGFPGAPCGKNKF